MAEKVIIEVEVDTKEGAARINKMKKGAEDAKESLEGIGKSGANASKGVEKVGVSFGTLAKASGILFLIEGALSLLMEALRNNQKFVDFFSTAMNAANIVVGDFVNFIVDNFGKVVDYFKGVFEDPVGSIKALGEAIKNNLIERFTSFLDTLGFVASAVKKVFQGDFSGALEDVKNAGKEMVDVFTGVPNAADKIANGVVKIAKATAEYTKETVKNAQALTELNKQAEIAEATNRGLIEQYDILAEEQRQIRDNEANTIAERIEANEKLSEVLEQQQELLRKNAQVRVNQAALQAKINKGNIEAERELIDARNELAAIDARITGQKSEQLSNENALRKELNDLVRSQAEASNIVALAEAERTIAAEQDAIKRLALEKNLLEQTTALQAEAIDAQIELEQEGTQRYQDLQNERLQIFEDAKTREAEIDRETELAKRERAQQTQQEAVDATLTGLSNIQAIITGFAAGNEARERRAFEINKRVQQAQAVIAALQSANNMFAAASKSPITALFPAYPYLAAGGALTAGLANARQIGQQQYQGGGAATGGGFSAPAISAGPSASTVGDTPQTQIAQAVTGTPTRAYVVSQEVTSGQALDRRILSNAQFG